MACLSAEELARCRRMRRPDQARRFALRKASLRRVLARYLRLSPQAVVLGHDDCGKPRLPHGGAGAPAFSVSHSDDLMVVAVSRSRDLGVDIERLLDFPNLDSVVSHHFTPSECAKLRELRGAERLASFYRAWTRKEAYLKARGWGLLHPPAAVEVSLLAEEPPLLIASPAEEGPPSEWSLADLHPAPGYLGALAVRGPLPTLRVFEEPARAPASHDRSGLWKECHEAH